MSGRRIAWWASFLLGVLHTAFAIFSSPDDRHWLLLEATLFYCVALLIQAMGDER